MSDRFFLDTNIFVYSFDQSAAAKLRRAKELIRRAIARGQGVVSFQVVQEFFNVALRRFERPMTVGEAEQYLAAVFRPLLSVHSSPALYGQALHLSERHRLAWYDSLIVAAAVQSDCAILYTEDLQHSQQIGDLRIVNPFFVESAQSTRRR
jgi:predicted nucleic acid-binding protein